MVYMLFLFLCIFLLSPRVSTLTLSRPHVRSFHALFNIGSASAGARVSRSASRSLMPLLFQETAKSGKDKAKNGKDVDVVDEVRLYCRLAATPYRFRPRDSCHRRLTVAASYACCTHALCFCAIIQRNARTPLNGICVLL